MGYLQKSVQDSIYQNKADPRRAKPYDVGVCECPEHSVLKIWRNFNECLNAFECDEDSSCVHPYHGQLQDQGHRSVVSGPI